MTVLAGTPCAKMIDFLGNSRIFAATPADSSKLRASKALFPILFPPFRSAEISGKFLVALMTVLAYDATTASRYRGGESQSMLKISSVQFIP